MRNFEERMTAIETRSQMRIARRRKQIASFCVPAVLCVCISTALLWPQPAQQLTADPTHTTAAYSGKITVTYGSERAEHSDPELVADICRMIQSLTPVQGVNQTYAEQNDERNVTVTSLGRRLTITVEDTQGVTAQFVLSGDVLMNTVSNETYALTQQQRTQLFSLLEQ